jgi:hypothetical protein
MAFLNPVNVILMGFQKAWITPEPANLEGDERVGSRCCNSGMLGKERVLSSSRGNHLTTQSSRTRDSSLCSSWTLYNA